MPIAEAPSATVKEVRIVDSGPPKAPPAPTRTLSPADISAMPEPTRPGGSDQPFTKSALRSRLEAKAKPAGDGTIVATPVKEPTKAPEKPPVTGEEADDTDAAPADQKPSEDENVPRGTKSSDIDPKTGKSKKANPWKLYDEEKKARATAEAEAQRLRSERVPEQERSIIVKERDEARKRNEELENEIRFVNYEKSKEFLTKYDEPWLAAWKDATKELSEISITDPVTQQQRAVTSEDILELTNMGLGRAREVADVVFGKFADDAMAHRKAIRELYQQRQSALDDARKNGGTRDRERHEQFQRQHQQVEEFARKAWEEAESTFVNDPKNGEYFRPKQVKEGEQPTPEQLEWNEAHEHGKKLVKEAWSVNATDPRLTPEQRKAAIKKNVAVAKRAIAFGPLKRAYLRALKTIEQQAKDLSEYSGSTPGAGGRQPEDKVQTDNRGLGGLYERLRKKAH